MVISQLRLTDPTIHQLVSNFSVARGVCCIVCTPVRMSVLQIYTHGTLHLPSSDNVGWSRQRHTLWMMVVHSSVRSIRRWLGCWQSM